MAEPRPSTDAENAPLLTRERDEDEDGENGLYNRSRPLTRLEKILAAAVLVLLILAATFIGLFAGTEHSLKKERGKPKHPVATTTQTATTTVHAPVPTGKPAKDVCTTPECVVAAADIIRALNTSADPCDDFYEYAVGGWLASNTIPPDRGLYGSFHQVSDNNKKIIGRVLDSIPADTDGSKGPEESNLRKLKDVYDSCMDVDRLDEQGHKPFLPLVDTVTDLFGTFDLNPLPDAAEAGLVAEADAWRGTYTDDYVLPESLRAKAVEAVAYREAKLRGVDLVVAAPPLKRAEPQVALNKAPKVPKERRERITSTLAFLHARGVPALFEFAIEGDAGGEDSQIQSLWFYQSDGGLPAKEYYDEKPALDLYQSVVEGILTHVANESEKSANGERSLIEEIEQVLEETEGWPWPWPGGDDDDDSKPEQPLKDRMARLADQVVQFETKIMKAGADPEYIFNPKYAYNPYSTKDVDAALSFVDLPTYLSAFAPRVFPANITVSYPPYLASISKLVADVPDHVLAAYFVTRLSLSYATALGPNVGVRMEKRRLEEFLQGIKKGTEENRHDVCLAWVDNLVGFIAGREFVREAFSPEAKADGEHIINSIVTAFNDKLPHIEWMDAESAAAAQKKAKAIIPKVGYPLYPNTTDPRSIQAWYSRVKISSDHFFDNVLSAELADNARPWLTLGRQRNRNGWEMYPQTVNAYYSPPDGEIVFPAGILQPPFYSLSWPSHLNYGAFGAVAAHELTHAFDNNGAQYDDHGRLRDWWTNKTVAAFDKRAECVVNQYSQYYVLDAEGNKHYVNGNLTNGENIADSGIAQAYAAWKQLEKPSTAALPGLDFTPDQLFFLSFARVWAQLTRPATAVARVRTDPHSPPFWRATGTLRNSDAFHKAFGCKSGTKMNPPKKDQCKLW